MPPRRAWVTVFATDMGVPPARSPHSCVSLQECHLLVPVTGDLQSQSFLLTVQPCLPHWLVGPRATAGEGRLWVGLFVSATGPTTPYCLAPDIYTLLISIPGHIPCPWTLPPLPAPLPCKFIPGYSGVPSHHTPDPRMYPHWAYDFTLCWKWPQPLFPLMLTPSLWL